LTASLLPHATIENWDRALLDFVHKNFILGAIGNWELVVPDWGVKFA
jgi:hypothetical protein